MYYAIVEEFSALGYRRFAAKFYRSVICRKSALDGNFSVKFHPVGYYGFIRSDYRVATHDYSRKSYFRIIRIAEFFDKVGFVIRSYRGSFYVEVKDLFSEYGQRVLFRPNRNRSDPGVHVVPINQFVLVRAYRFSVYLRFYLRRTRRPRIRRFFVFERYIAVVYRITDENADVARFSALSEHGSVRIQRALPVNRNDCSVVLHFPSVHDLRGVQHNFVVVYALSVVYKALFPAYLPYFKKAAVDYFSFVDEQKSFAVKRGVFRYVQHLVRADGYVRGQVDFPVISAVEQRYKFGSVAGVPDCSLYRESSFRASLILRSRFCGNRHFRDARVYVIVESKRKIRRFFVGRNRCERFPRFRTNRHGDFFRRSVVNDIVRPLANYCQFSEVVSCLRTSAVVVVGTTRTASESQSDCKYYRKNDADKKIFSFHF